MCCSYELTHFRGKRAVLPLLPHHEPRDAIQVPCFTSGYFTSLVAPVKSSENPRGFLVPFFLLPFIKFVVLKELFISSEQNKIQ